jgi:hypothetical protein
MRGVFYLQTELWTVPLKTTRKEGLIISRNTALAALPLLVVSLYVYYPFVASFAGKEIPFPIFMAFVAGKQVYDFARLPMEISFIGPGIALIRNLITIPVPIIMGLLARYFYPGKFAETPFWKEGGNIGGTNINP